VRGGGGVIVAFLSESFACEKNCPCINKSLFVSKETRLTDRSIIIKTHYFICSFFLAKTTNNLPLMFIFFLFFRSIT
jgi:hypothetical protein